MCQGGLQSLEEAVTRAVPVVMPFIADQEGNSHRVVERGIGIRVDPNNIRRNQLKETILEVVRNDK